MGGGARGNEGQRVENKKVEAGGGGVKTGKGGSWSSVWRRGGVQL